MRHPYAVTSLAFSPCGEYLASGSIDNTAVVWSIVTERKLASLEHEDYIRSVAFSPDGKCLATGSGNDSTMIWAVATERKLASFEHDIQHMNDMYVWRVDFSPDGKYLATGSWEETADILNVATERKLASFEHDHIVWAVDFSPDGKYLATNGKIFAVKESENGKTNIVLRLKRIAWSVSFNPSGRYFVFEYQRDYCIAEWRKNKIIKTERTEGEVWYLSWFKRFPVWNDHTTRIYSPFAEIQEKHISRMDLSRRGFLAIGYWNGLIKVIREGKGI